jgi:hypothetical protein
VTDAGVQALHTQAPQLGYLGVAGCPKVTPGCVRRLLEKRDSTGVPWLLTDLLLQRLAANS